MSDFDEYDMTDLAASIAGFDPDNYDESAVEDILLEKFDLELSQFYIACRLLVPYATSAVSPLTCKPLQGFSKDGVFLVRSEMKSKSRCKK